MLVSEAHGHKVVSTSDAATAGTVDGFLIDPAAGQVAGLTLKKTAGNGSVLPWSDVTAFGVDAVTIADAKLIVEPQGELAELGGKAHHFGKKRVLTTAGLQVGTVRDIAFDPATGKIISIITDDQPVDGSSLVGIGSYAVMVRV